VKKQGRAGKKLVKKIFFLLITCKSAQRADGIVKKQGRAGKKLEKNIFLLIYL
jgi:hypothetical protein